MIEQNERELFKLVAPYKPTGDQPEAIAKLVEGIKRGDKEQTLLGVTGSGKTFTMANIIAQAQRPTLVLAHNKTLAAQLCMNSANFSRPPQWSILFPIMIICINCIIYCRFLPLYLAKMNQITLNEQGDKRRS